MQKTILDMADRLRFDEKTIGQLKQVSEHMLEQDEIIKRDKKRNADLEVALDLANAIIKSYDGINWHGW